MEEIIRSLEQINFGKITIAVLVLVVCLSVSKIAAKLISNALRKIDAIDASLYTILNTIIKSVLHFISVLAAAGALDIPITSFLALFSVIGLAVSLAVQGVLTNLAGGVIILASKPFTLNDFIECDTIIGTVKDIGILHTQLLSPDGKFIYIPNSLLQSSRLINYSASGFRRIELQVNVSYDNSPEQVRAAVMKAVATLPHVMTDPEPRVLLEKYGPHSILYSIWVYVPSEDFLTGKYGLNEAIYTKFAENGITMTRPHLNIHMN